MVLQLDLDGLIRENALAGFNRDGFYIEVSYPDRSAGPSFDSEQTRCGSHALIAAFLWRSQRHGGFIGTATECDGPSFLGCLDALTDGVEKPGNLEPFNGRVPGELYGH